MGRSILLTFAAALGGALLGAGAALWRFSPESSAPVAAADSAALERRVQALEDGLRAIDARVRTLPVRADPREPPPAEAPPAPSEPAGASAAPHPIDTPVFEAAVIDIIERAEEDRDRERAAAKDEKRRDKARRWADELTLRLTLSPAQTERLLEIDADLDAELRQERERSSQPDAPFISKERRSATRQALRERADGRLRALLAPAQLAAYDVLDDRLKLYRPKDVD